MIHHLRPIIGLMLSYRPIPASFTLAKLYYTIDNVLINNLVTEADNVSYLCSVGLRCEIA
jgi:hypothetical protein